MYGLMDECSALSSVIICLLFFSDRSSGTSCSIDYREIQGDIHIVETVST